mgnify:CR=1 FL=1
MLRRRKPHAMRENLDRNAINRFLFNAHWNFFSVRSNKREAVRKQIALIFLEKGNIIKHRNDNELKRDRETFHSNAGETALTDIKNIQAKLKFKDQATVQEIRRVKRKCKWKTIWTERKYKRLDTMNRVKEHRWIITEQSEVIFRFDFLSGHFTSLPIRICHRHVIQKEPSMQPIDEGYHRTNCFHSKKLICAASTN